ncbi:MAG TPA: hypothetical protein VG270_02975 [Pseudolabrys sp.]|jgi:hypothetical protein|nr:hypothetical protein [Pseudolabrys sp.]
MDESASRKYPVREDMAFQRRSWMVERAGWVLLAVIALAGLTGVLGNGPLSWAHASAGALSVSYERFQRATKSSAFVFDVTQQTGDEITLHLGAPFQRNFEFSSIQPPPRRSRTGPQGIDLTFPASGAGRSRIVIWARPRRYGLSTITAAAEHAAPASLRVLVYP